MSLTIMEKTKVLYITQETIPYTPETTIANTVRNLPQYIQENGNEVRMFMPRYGIINERRHQLHEVIRLSGMNVVVNETDHPVIVKVASLPQAKMQVYFIDNEEYFHRKSVFHGENDEFFNDNDERSIFFCKGVLETIKKLGWVPDIIHCHGWMTSLVPLYIKNVFSEDHVFMNSRVIFSAYNDNEWEGKLNEKLFSKANFNKNTEKHLKKYQDVTWQNLVKIAAEFSDGLILHQENKEISSFAKKNNTNCLVTSETDFESIHSFYEEVLETNSVSL